MSGEEWFTSITIPWNSDRWDAMRKYLFGNITVVQPLRIDNLLCKSITQKQKKANLMTSLVVNHALLSRLNQQEDCAKPRLLDYRGIERSKIITWTCVANKR